MMLDIIKRENYRVFHKNTHLNLTVLRWKSLSQVHREFPQESVSKIFFKISPHLPKL